MAVSGGGLTNWWSILTKLVGNAEGYEVDGVIFAVFAEEFCDASSPPGTTPSGTIPSSVAPIDWEPESYPATLAEAPPVPPASPECHPLVSRCSERSLQGHWPRAIPRPFLAAPAHPRSGGLSAIDGGEANQPEETASDPARDRLISEIGRTLATRRAAGPGDPDSRPAGQACSTPDGARWQKRESEAFARSIGARFLDGGRIFEGRSTAETQGLFLPHDGHWNQAGSDQFAEFVTRNLDLLLLSAQAERGRVLEGPDATYFRSPSGTLLSDACRSRTWHVNSAPSSSRNRPI